MTVSHLCSSNLPIFLLSFVGICLKIIPIVSVSSSFPPIPTPPLTILLKLGIKTTNYFHTEKMPQLIFSPLLFDPQQHQSHFITLFSLYFSLHTTAPTEWVFLVFSVSPSFSPRPLLTTECPRLNLWSSTLDLHSLSQ